MTQALKRWALLLAFSAGLATAMRLLHVPAALLLGPLVAAAVMAACDARPSIPLRAFLLTQGLIGTMVAGTIPLEVLGEFARDWPIFIPGIVSVVAISTLLGWLLTRWQVLPGTTAIWGTSPGAASVMILMAGSHGDDMRLVAFMQYLRIVIVALMAAAVARIWMGPSTAAAVAAAWFPPVHWTALGETLLLAVGGATIGTVVRFPAGPFLGPLVLGVILRHAGLITIELPPWLLAGAYAVAGWRIGSGFDRPILRHALRALPQMLAAILAMLALCGAVAGVLVVAAGVDPLTAYLATSPGGADTVAIISAGSQVDLPFVMAMQTSRLLLVLLVGPWIARAVANAEKRRMRRLRGEAAP